MKFLASITFLFFLSNNLFAQSTKGFVTINGFFTDISDSAEIAYLHPSANEPIAITSAKNKKFKLFAPVSFSGLCRIVIKSNQGVFNYDLFAGAENITLSGSLAKIDLAKITGAKYQTDFKQIIKKFEPQFKEINSISQQIQLEQDQNKKAALFQQSQIIQNKIGLQIDSLVKKKSSNPVTAFVLYITKNFYTGNPTIIANRLKLLKGEASTSIYATSLQQESEQRMMGTIGSQAADFTQNDENDKPVSLSSFKGKYVLLDFWASWCRPCRDENPNVVAAYNKFKTKNFTVLGVSLDREGAKEAWVNAIKDDNLTWTHVSDLKFWANAVAQKYMVSSIPQNFLIDPKGIIIGKNLRGAELDRKLCEVLGCD